MSTCNHNHCQEKAIKSAEEICQKIGARFTDHRRRVFDIIWGTHKALTAADIMEALDNKQPPMTYRALEFLKDAKLIHHITSLNAYVGCAHPEQNNHVGQMLICRICKDVMEITSSKVRKKLEEEAQNTGFAPDQIHIEMLGTCQQCSKA